MTDPAEVILANFQWLVDNPEFDERPPSIDEFLGPDYLNIAHGVRQRVRAELVNIIGEEFVPGQIARYSEALITGGIGIGKGQLATDVVATPTGWRSIGALVPGDLVIGSAGTPVRVLGTFPRGELEVFKVGFGDGTSLVVDGDHLWSVTTPVDRRRGENRVIATRDLAKKRFNYHGCASYTYRIPIVAPVQYEEKDFPLSPYALGALLGDGHFGKQVTLSGLDEEIPLRIVSENPGIAWTRSYQSWVFRGIACRRNPLLGIIQSLGLAGRLGMEKFIPIEYMFGSIAQRLALVQGLMDTDGGITTENAAVFYNNNPLLCEQLAELVRSLGGTARTRERSDRPGAYECKVRLPADLPPFFVTRKLARWKGPRQALVRSITSVTPAGTGAVVCIAVDAPDNLYVARDYIVTHNTTIASIVLAYMVCCTLCLRDPQDYYSLLPGSKIAFMMMSTKRTQAIQVIFSDTKARIDNSPWFKERWPRDDAYKNLLAWPQKDVMIVPGDSLETSFEGWNILGGVIDEIDSHRVTQSKDYAESGYTTISARITSRFGKRGFLVLIGQTKTQGGFAMRRLEEFKSRDDKYAVKLAIWDSLDPKNFSGRVFYYDILRSKVLHSDEFERQGLAEGPTLIKVPIEYLDDFEKDPDKALRDLAGVPRATEDPFIRNTDKIFSATDRYDGNHPFLHEPWRNGRLHPSLKCTDSLPRYGHIDLAYSATTGDCSGLAIGHIREYVETDEGLKPYIVIDVVARLVPPAGRQLELSEVREVLYDLCDRGFRVRKVTTDGFESTDTIQMLRKRHISADLLSVDKKLLPYADLRDAIYENRIEYPRVMGKRKRADRTEVDILALELSQLGYDPNGTKVDHPAGGTKDCSDAVAGVVHNLMIRARRGGALRSPEATGTRTLASAMTTLRPVGSDPLGMPQLPEGLAPNFLRG